MVGDVFGEPPGKIILYWSLVLARWTSLWAEFGCLRHHLWRLRTHPDNFRIAHLILVNTQGWLIGGVIILRIVGGISILEVAGVVSRLGADDAERVWMRVSGVISVHFLAQMAAVKLVNVWIDKVNIEVSVHSLLSLWQNFLLTPRINLVICTFVLGLFIRRTHLDVLVGFSLIKVV